jgi:hypothetical protein
VTVERKTAKRIGNIFPHTTMMQNAKMNVITMKMTMMVVTNDNDDDDGSKRPDERAIFYK